MRTITTSIFLAACFSLFLSSCKPAGRQAGHQERIDRYHIEKEVK